MTSERDTERLLDEWLSDGPTVAADRVIDNVAGRIGRQSQRPAWLVSWRESPVNSYLKPILGVAAVIVVVVAGLAILGGPSVFNIGAPPSASPSPSMPTPTPSQTLGPTGLHEGVLPAGQVSTSCRLDSAPTLTIDATVPDTGWQGVPKWGLMGPIGTGAPRGIGIGFLMPAGLFSDPCHWDRAGNGRWPQQGDIPTGSTVAELVAALSSNSHFVASPATDAVVGGYPAKRMDLQLPSDVDFATCDVDTWDGDVSGTFLVWGTAEADGSDLYAQGPGNVWHLSIVDASGVRFVVVVADYATTRAQDKAAAQAIVDSLVITP